MLGLVPDNEVTLGALLGDVAPRGGRTLIVSGSHRLIHRHFRDNPPPPAARGVDYRHPLVLHVATSNNSDAPRFLLSGGVDLPAMWGTAVL